MKIKLVLRKDCNYRIDVFNESDEAIAVIHMDDLFNTVEQVDKLRKGDTFILTDGIDNDVYKDKP